MKPIRLIHRISAAALALLMLASLPACKEQPTTPAESDNDTTQQVTDTPEATTPSDETEAPVDPSEPDVSLTAENAVIVLSAYAAAWEKTAAEELSAESPRRKRLFINFKCKLRNIFLKVFIIKVFS